MERAAEATLVKIGSVLDSSESGARKMGRLERGRRSNLDGVATREGEPATLDP
jgi:hypothetical protein